MSVFRLKVFPARDGDCLLLSYGSETKLSHILIDGGRQGAYPLLRLEMEAIKARGESLDLHILTHIDADHIEGMLALAADPELPLAPRDIWYNGFAQLRRLARPLQTRGFKQADKFSEALKARGWPINAFFGGKLISTDRVASPFDFGPLRLTLVSPDDAHLRKLRTNWEEWRTGEEQKKPAAPTGPLARTKRTPMPAVLDVDALARPTPGDTTVPNGSSIALIVEYEGRRVFLAGDAHPDLLEATMAPLAAAEGGQYRIDLIKLSHHGSKANVNEALLRLLDSSRYIFSSNGDIHGHPNPEAVARVIKYGGDKPKTLYFNYASTYTTPWNDPVLKAQHGLDCQYPSAAGAPLTIDI